LEKTYLLVIAKECMKPGLKVQRQGMRCISCALVLRGLEKGEEKGKRVRWLEKTYVPFGDGWGMHIARIEGPAAGYALYLLRPGIEGTGERGWERQNG
jgi:hypothetical protein